MARKYKYQHDQLTERREALCEVRMDADRIMMAFEEIYPKPLRRVAEEMENIRLCAYTLVEDNTLYLMHPDFGMFGSDDEFRAIASELFDEVNYDITYID